MKVLCVIDYFLPGFRGGGPIRTIDNMRKQLAGHVTMSIFTRDRDLGSDRPYPEIKTDRWLDTPHGEVYYASPHVFGPKGFRMARSMRHFDVVYLNSFFSPRSSILLWLTQRRFAPTQPVLVAPRGEFSVGALAVKKTKKRAYIALAHLLNLYRHASWHASTELEAQDILRQFPQAEGKIHIAADPVVAQPPAAVPDAPRKQPGQLRLAFISRISPKKNLDGLLEILRDTCAPVRLDIFGPVEDHAYWRQCGEGIAALPDNIRVKSHGPLAPDEVSSTFAGYDLFVFPTHGENFGHVIFESLRAGTPVLLSDQTPWQPDVTGAVTILPLGDKDGWRHAIEQAAERTPKNQACVRTATRGYAARYATGESSFRANLEMFRAMVS